MTLRPLTAIAAIACLAALPATAAGVQTEDVKIDRAALETADGVEAAYVDLRESAEAVCDAQVWPRPLSEFMRSRSCFREALDKAVADVDHPTLTAYHQARSNG